MEVEGRVLKDNNLKCCMVLKFSMVTENTLWVIRKRKWTIICTKGLKIKSALEMVAISLIIIILF